VRCRRRAPGATGGNLVDPGRYSSTIIGMPKLTGPPDGGSRVQSRLTSFLAEASGQHRRTPHTTLHVKTGEVHRSTSAVYVDDLGVSSHSPVNRSFQEHRQASGTTRRSYRSSFRCGAPIAGGGGIGQTRGRGVRGRPSRRAPPAPRPARSPSSRTAPARTSVEVDVAGVGNLTAPGGSCSAVTRTTGTSSARPTTTAGSRRGSATADTAPRHRPVSSCGAPCRVSRCPDWRHRSGALDQVRQLVKRVRRSCCLRLVGQYRVRLCGGSAT
jgi:hypothetical protein